MENSINSKKISFVIPCRNESKYIEKTVNSILNQKLVQNDFEIIIVDALSTDGTREKITKLKETDNRIILIDNNRKITPVALNIGVKRATGDYIFILGGHSQIDSYYVHHCLKIFEDHKDVSCAGGPITSIGNSSLGKAIALAMSSRIGVGNSMHRFPDYEGYAEMACFPVFKKEVFAKIGFFDESLIRNQDDDFCFRLRLNGDKIYISSKAKSGYFVRDNLYKLFTQYSQYGYWRIALLKKHKMQIAFRQQIPFLFFLVVIISFLLSLMISKLILGFILPICYLTTITLYSVKISVLDKRYFGFWLLLVIPVLHFSYAYGFFKGILYFLI
ncbi:MAG TPA: glycosyltransferase family 2 protein, partial [Ignavibacteriaceae bacterium]|nr:glycosyltransferase family 2 protein [Ignavibacteriaceae bacterium]